jgi:hypothetical protein
MAVSKPRQQPKPSQQRLDEPEQHAFVDGRSEEPEGSDRKSEVCETPDWNSAGLRRKRRPWD